MNLGEGHKAPMQLDANMGIVNALQEMLLYVSKDLVKVLPACPNKFSKGSVKGFRFCTGEIDFSWDKELGKFSSELKAKRETNITLLLPEICEEYELLYVESGEKNLIQKRSAFTVNLPKGCSLIIKNKD
jgi:alpha-L-fucosidase 2